MATSSGSLAAVHSRALRHLGPIVAFAALLPAVCLVQSAQAEATPSLGLLDAVTLMLENDPNVAIAESNVRSSEGGVLVEGARFDPFLTASVGAEDSETPLSETSISEVQAQSAQVSVDQLFRSGLSVVGDLDLTRSEATAPATNLGTLSFTLRQPLARGRGRDTTTASERSSNVLLEASELDLRQRIAERIFSVVNNYWSVASAQADVTILRESEKRSGATFETYQRLVEADSVPAAELVQLEADVMSRRGSRLAAEQTLFARRQALGREIGFDARGAAALPLPAERFPRIEPGSVPQPLDSALLAVSESQRADLLALQRRLESSQILLELAENTLLPRIDLVLTPSYTGVTEDNEIGGLFSSLTDNIPGLSTTFGVTYAWPLKNRSAEGRFLQSQSSRDNRISQIDLLRNRITTETASAIDALRASAEQLELAIKAVALFEKALDNEQKKLRASRSTLLDTITQEDRLTSAQLRLNAAELSLAQAVLRLRFWTGTLIDPTGDDITLDLDHLTTVPKGAASGN